MAKITLMKPYRQGETLRLYEQTDIVNVIRKGEYSEIPFEWDEAKQILTIGKRKGYYPGMSAKRVFIVKLQGGKKKTVLYKGNTKRIKF